MGRPAGRELTAEERARVRKLRRMALEGRYAGTLEGRQARQELRQELLALHRTGASVASLAAGLGVAKSRAGVLLQEARTATARPDTDRRTA